MTLAITLIDKSTSGNVASKTTLRLVSKRLTLREIITQRIREEVDKFNQQKKHEVFNGLVQPSNTERSLNGYKLRNPRLVDFGEQLQLALDAFESNGFFVLLDDKQVAGLDEPLTLQEHSTVSFVKLVPLVGG